MGLGIKLRVVLISGIRVEGMSLILVMKINIFALTVIEDGHEGYSIWESPHHSPLLLLVYSDRLES